MRIGEVEKPEENLNYSRRTIICSKFAISVCKDSKVKRFQRLLILNKIIKKN